MTGQVRSARACCGEGGSGDDGERGQAVSVLMVGLVAVLIMMAGLVIDGGQKATAVSRAEAAAAGAARAAANAGAGTTLAGGGAATVAPGRARQAARSYLAGLSGGDGPAVTGTVSVVGSTVRVHTTAKVSTIFLSVIGIDQLRGTAEATARVMPT